MTCPDKNFRVVFKSIPMPQPTHQWEAQLAFPAHAADADVMPLTVTHWDGTPIEAATFECLGGRWKIVNGCGQITCADFIKGLNAKETAIWLHQPGIEPVPGGLTFA